MGRPTVTKFYPVSDGWDSDGFVPFGQWEPDESNGHLSHQRLLDQQWQGETSLLPWAGFGILGAEGSGYQ